MPLLLARLHLAATLFMTGLIWFVQVVHYPLFAAVGSEGFSQYEALHQARTTWVVAPVMLLELMTGLALLARRPSGWPRWLPAVGAGLLLVLWLWTVLRMVPLHQQLALHGFDAAVVAALVTGNWLRTAAWSARAVLFTAYLPTAGSARRL